MQNTKTTINIKGISVEIDNLVIEDEDLTTLLINSEDTETAFKEIVRTGVKTMQTIKGSLEIDFIKDSISKIISEFKKKGDEHNKIIEDVHTKYFGEDDGELVKDLSGIVKNFEESIVNEVSGDNNPNSSINKFKLAADEMEKQITESINEAFNPNSEEDQNIASIMVKTIVDKITDPIAAQFRILFQHLDVENALDNTTQKGFVFEDELKIVLQNVKGPKDLVEHCGKKAGIKSRNFKGDFVVQFPDEEGLPSPAKVVFEAKNHKSITNFKDTIGYLDDAMANREANCAVWIVKDQNTISQFTDQPFYEYNNRYAFVVFNEDTGDMALRFAFSWAMLKSRELMGVTSDSFDKVEANRLLSIMIKDVKQFGSLRTNNNSILSIAGENKTTINNLESSFDECIKQLSETVNDN